MFALLILLINSIHFLTNAASLPVPIWNIKKANRSINDSWGIPTIPETHYIIYNATLENGNKNPNGTYNHGPIPILFKDVFYVSWYNSPQNESENMRALYATSKDSKTWSKPMELFPQVVGKHNENEPWVIINDRLYASYGINSYYPLMRQVISPTGLGDIFWLNQTAYISSFNFSTYLEMPQDIINDMEIYLGSLVMQHIILC